MTKAQAQNLVTMVFEKRAQGMLGVVESNIQRKGDDQIIVELPGKITLDEARSIMGSTAKLVWYHATNLNTEQVSYRPYVDIDGKDSKNPVVSFRRANGSGDTIEPGTPEYAQVIAGWTPIIEGTDLASARVEGTPNGKAIPVFTFSSEGSKKMEAWSKAFFGKQEKIAAVLDKTVISVAPLEKDAIIRDGANITGDFTVEYVKTLTDLFNSGALPVPLNEISASTVDPTIGKFALNQIVTTGAIAFSIIALFLIIYYVFPGFVALAALGLYVLFTLTAMKLFNATFSLAAIAGFILSVGMAVDANILVFERFKEEMREGRTLEKAIDLGFNRAFPAILDSNACTILTSLVLYRLGTGPVQGFATSLIIGVAISLFTAVIITRSLLKFLVGSGIGTNPKWYGLGRNWFGEKFEQTANENPIKIVEKSKLWFAISAITIIPGVIFLATSGLKANVDFRGGYEAQIAVKSDVTGKSINELLEKAGYKDPNVKFASARDEKDQPFRLAMLTLPEEGTLKDAGNDAGVKIAEAIGYTKDDLKGFSKVSATVRDETLRNAVLGVVISSALIVLWLAIRFGFALGGFVMGLRFSMSVILALIHDVLFVLGVASIAGALLGWEVSALFISAMLTVIGFSTHDSIVIFDRIRENLNRPLPGEDMSHLVNRSVSQSFARSINTSLTVVVTLVLLIAFGSATPDMQLFNATMLAGIISGTYSSIFNAAPILYLWDKAVVKRRGESSSMIAVAKQAAADRARAALSTSSGQVADAPQSYGQTKRRRANDQYSKHIDD